MAEDTAAQDLNSIVQAIGFGIVSDFRDLRQSMYGISAEMDESNRMLGGVNDNLASTNRSLDQLEKDVYRQIDSRQFKQLENQVEAKNRQSMRRNDEIMRSILNAVNDMKRQAGGVRTQIDSEGNVKQEVDVPENQASGGSFLGSAGALIGAAALGTVAAVGTAYMMSGSTDSTGAQPPSNPPSAPPIAPPLPMANAPGPSMAAATPMAAPPVPAPSLAQSPSQKAQPTKEAAIPAAPNLTPPTPPKSNVNISNASQAVSAITNTAKSKALAKVQTKAANWFSRNGGRIVNTIGHQYVQTFGNLVGSRFSFNKYVSDDSWTNLGLAYVNGLPLPDTSKGEPNAAYVAQVIINLAIQAYLISREIYTEENASEITNNLVPNFDDVEESERKQVVKNVGASLETYVNFLIDRERLATSAAVPTGATPTPSPTTAPDLTPPPTTSAAGAQMGGAAGGGGQAGGGLSGAPAPSSVGGGGQAPAANEMPQTDAQTQNQSYTATGEPGLDTQTTSPAAGPAASGGGQQEASDAEVSPSDTTAGFSTTQNLAGDISTSGDYGPILDYIADSEGADYNTQFGYQNTTNGRALTEMTVAEVMQAQRAQTGSSAIGRYQFMRQTMKDLIAAGVISPDEQFSPATQDRMATYLIDKKRRGSAWKAGKISDEQFGRSLAQEWASVPDPYTGKGYYGGQRAKHGTDVLMNVLKSSKNVRSDAETTGGDTSSNQSSTSSPTKAATGAVITPLPSDKASSNMSMALAPSTIEQQATASGAGSEEDTTSSSVSPVDARKKGQTSNPHDDAKNKIAYYGYLMTHHFGNLKKDMEQAQEESTSDEYHFGRALDPLV